MTFANDNCLFGVHRYPHAGDVDGKEGTAVFPRQDAPRLNGLPTPAIKAEDPVGFRDRKPAFDIGKLAPIGFTRADLPWPQAASQRLYLLCREAHHFVLTLKTGSGLE